MSLGMVLAGGAARGAYEAGVLRFLFRDLADRIGFQPWPDVVSGTSVGALNGVFVAARDQEGLARLCDTWETLQLRDVFHLHPTAVFRAARATFRPEGPFALLDNRPLVKLIHDRFPKESFRRALDSGTTRAMIIAATDLANGFNTLFTDSAKPLDFRTAPGTIRQPVRIGPEHTLASTALPFLFTPVEIGGRHYVDGGLRLNTPLRPVIKAGANRILVIGLKKPDGYQAGEAQLTPNLPFLLGKTLNALLLDPVEQDARQVENMNELVAWGVQRYGPEFATALDADLGFRTIDLVRINPSEDIGEMAATIFRSREVKASPSVRTLLNLVADRANTGEADLLSYLFFDRAFTGALERLGFEDARREEERLATLLLTPRRDRPSRSSVNGMQ